MKPVHDLRAAIQTWRRRLSWGGEGTQVGRLGPELAKDEPVVDSDLLAKLDRLSLRLGRELISGLMGEHSALRRTAGIEFADHRPYSAGDDLRRVDWNAYARLGTLHVRQSQAEHDTILYLLVDASPSMDFGNPTKFLAARRLAASLGYIALAHLDAVVMTTPGGNYEYLHPKSPQSMFRSRAEAGEMFRALQWLRVGSAAAFDAVLGEWAAQQGKRGQGRLAVVLSDLLLDEYRAGIKGLVSAGFQVTVLHMLSKEELAPADSGDLDFVDSETGERMEIYLGKESAAAYDRRVKEWLADTESWCRSQGANYLLVRSDWDVERVMLDTLRRRGVTAS